MCKYKGMESFLGSSTIFVSSLVASASRKITVEVFSSCREHKHLIGADDDQVD